MPAAAATAQYQFWIDGNLNGIVGDAGDKLLRDWTDGSTFVDAPLVATRYGVRVRCSTRHILSRRKCAQRGGQLPVHRQREGAVSRKRSTWTRRVCSQPEPDPAVTVSWATTT
jgi:hypothetical protein